MNIAEMYSGTRRWYSPISSATTCDVIKCLETLDRWIAMTQCKDDLFPTVDTIRERIIGTENLKTSFHVQNTITCFIININCYCYIWIIHIITPLNRFQDDSQIPWSFVSSYCLSRYILTAQPTSIGFTVCLCLIMCKRCIYAPPHLNLNFLLFQWLSFTFQFWCIHSITSNLPSVG